MNTAWSSTANVEKKKPPKLYVMKVNEKSGALYLEREYHPMFVKCIHLSILIAAVMFALLSCLRYIHLKTNVEYRIRQTQVLESQLYTLQNENQLAEKDTTYIHDLNYIFEVATDTLNMVPASETNIVFYHRTDKEYVFQGENVPLVGLP